jgi:exo-beta-1,3-glucanase (GH17 family)/photosystem II stability/assembly factor-like uncharacterized protein
VARSFLVLLSLAIAFASSGQKRRAIDFPGLPGQWALVRGIPETGTVACTPAAIVAANGAAGVTTFDESAAVAHDGVKNVTAMMRAHTGALFAATAGAGVFRSSDDGASWQRLANAPLSATFLASTFQLLFAGGCDGLFASDDQGTTWLPRGDGLGSCVTGIVARGSYLFAGTKSGIYRSVNAAVRWRSFGGVSSEIYALAIDPLGRLFAATRTGVLRSTDGGDAWSASLSSNDVRALFVDEGGDVYAGTSQGAVLRSTDGGATWSDVHAGLPPSPVSAFCATNASLYAAGGGRLFRTPFPFRLFGVDFGPYTGNQDPNYGASVTDAQLTTLLGTVQPHVRWIRTYGTSSDLVHAAAIAHSLGLKTAVNAWLGRDAATNEIQIANLIAAARDGHADLLIVGSEAFLRVDLDEKTLIGYLTRVRQAATGIPIAYADSHEQWIAHPNVADYVDVVLVNEYPYWEGIRIESAVAVSNAWLRDVLSVVGNRPVIVSETGWPSQGNTIGEAVPSPENAIRHFTNVVSWARATRTPSFYFEAFDEPWKAAYEGTQGAHWGIWDNQGRLKSGMNVPLAGATLPDNWTSTDVPGGPGSPLLEFTSVPELNTFDNLRGRVLHVNPYLYKVLVYIYISGWWVKPYANRPLTTIAGDGTWIADITTGGIDEKATRIAAFLVRSTYRPPILLGDSTIPNDVYNNAAARAATTR